MHVTGPLIRVLGERFSTDIKAAILETLTTFMGKVSERMKYEMKENSMCLGWCSITTIFTATSTNTFERFE